MRKANNKSILSCLLSALMLTLMLGVMDPITAEAAVKLNKTEATVKVGKTTKLKIKGAKDAKVKWSSSKKKIATVSNKGVVTGKKPGKTTIKAKVGGKTYKCQLSVLCRQHKYVETTIPATADHAAYKCKKCKVCGYETDKEEILPQLTEAEAQAKLMALKSQYPDGMIWDLDNVYVWTATNCICRACAAFTAIMSDSVFGVDAPATLSNKVCDVKIGDVISFSYTITGVGTYSHRAIIIAKEGNILTTAEGNVDGKVKWGNQYIITSPTTIDFYLGSPEFATDGADITTVTIISRYQQ